VYLMFNKTVYSVLTTIYQFLGYMFRFLQNYVQNNVEHREVHSVCTQIMGSQSVYPIIDKVAFLKGFFFTVHRAF